ncbi:hypothetical protein ACAG25_17755 [Mycobacterium sp. pV006]
MTAPVRIAAFTAALAAVFVAAFWVGQVFGPEPAPPAPHPHSHVGETP